MQIYTTEDALVLAGLDLFLVELLRQIPVSAEPEDHAAVRERLFGKPSRDDPQLNRDWADYIQPDLEKSFEEAKNTVRRDLDQCMDGGGETGMEDYRLGIPRKHFEPWLNSLNQARLALAVRNEFTDKEMERDLPASLDSARDLSLFQIHFYGLIQECLVRELSS